MNTQTFQRLGSLVYRESGIRLKEGKEAMVAGRLSRRIRELGLQDAVEYLDFIESEDPNEIVALLNLITTNVTHFFRENEHFEFLKKQYSAWLEEGQNRFRFWCAAAATGEEPYTLSMVLQETAERCGVRPDTKVLCTDLSTEALRFAQDGTYSKQRLEGVSHSLLQKYASPVMGSSDQFQFQALAKRLLVFKRLNLSQPPFPMRGPLDTVFCRNVMFYFDGPVIERLVEAIHGLLRPDGFLVIGKSENVPATKGLFERVGPSIYRKLA